MSSSSVFWGRKSNFSVLSQTERKCRNQWNETFSRYLLRFIPLVSVCDLKKKRIYGVCFLLCFIHFHCCGTCVVFREKVNYREECTWQCSAIYLPTSFYWDKRHDNEIIWRIVAKSLKHYLDRIRSELLNFKIGYKF